jgi:hypothetical protein
MLGDGRIGQCPVKHAGLSNYLENPRGTLLVIRVSVIHFEIFWLQFEEAI